MPYANQESPLSSLCRSAQGFLQLVNSNLFNGYIYIFTTCVFNFLEFTLQHVAEAKSYLCRIQSNTDFCIDSLNMQNYIGTSFLSQRFGENIHFHSLLTTMSQLDTRCYSILSHCKVSWTFCSISALAPSLVRQCTSEPKWKSCLPNAGKAMLVNTQLPSQWTSSLLAAEEAEV